MTEAEKKKHKAGTPIEKIVLDRIWNKRPDGFAIKMPTKETADELVILEFKRMSCVTDQYVRRARNVVENQYVSIKSALERTLGPKGWIVSQRSFITGARSLNEKDLHDNLAYFKVPQAGIESIRSKLAFIIFDEYANILKGMYSTRFNRRKGEGEEGSRLVPSHFITYISIHIEGDDHKVAPNPPLSHTTELTARINETA